MATMNFSVPDDVKQEFLDAFADENKSAVIARLMRQAVEDRKRQQNRASAIVRRPSSRKLAASPAN